MLQSIEISALQTKPNEIRHGLGLWGKFTNNNNSRQVDIHWDNPDDKNRDMSDGDVWLKWSNIFKDTYPERFIVPQIFQNLDSFINRKLKIKWLEKGSRALERWSQTFIGLRMLGKLTSPNFIVNATLKVHKDLPHGLPSIEQLIPTQGEGFYTYAKKYRTECRPDMASNSTAAYSWKTILKPLNNENNLSLILPVADLDTLDRSSLRRAARALSLHGFSGSIIRTGESTHFMSDFFIPSSLGPQVVGKLMETLSPESNTKAQELAQMYASSNNFNDAKIASHHTLNAFPSGQHYDSDIDYRFLAHAYVHNQGHASLRLFDAKGYGFDPYEICQII